MQGWQYLFLIEGSLTVEIALWALLWLPRSVQASHLFTEEQKKCATLRKVKESESFSWVEGIHVLKDWKVWTFAFSALLYGVGVASSSNFLPVILSHLTENYTKALANIGVSPRL